MRPNAKTDPDRKTLKTARRECSVKGVLREKGAQRKGVRRVKGCAECGGKAYEKTPGPLGETGVVRNQPRVRAEGLEPSTQGLKVLCSTD